MSNIIYIITNTINCKVYIGQTTNFENRKKKHFYLFKKLDQHIYRAMRKYGVDKFNIFPICSVINEQDLNDIEIQFIKEYDSFHNGYNMTLGCYGLRGYSHSKETKLKISKGNKNKTISTATKLKMRKSTLNKSSKYIQINTPWGRFGLLKTAAKMSPYKININTLSYYCKNNTNKITKHMINKMEFLKEDMIDKTFKEIGFSCITK